MKNLFIEKLSKEKSLDQTDGIIAFQMVKFSFDFFGHTEETVLDTKILKNGDQLVIDGDGFIPAGYKIS